LARLWLNDKLTIHTTTKVGLSEGTNSNLPARNTLVHFLPRTPTWQPQMHSVTDRQTNGPTDGQTDDRMMPIADHTV